MIEKVICDEKGDLEIDISGDEILKRRADIEMSIDKKEVSPEVNFNTHEGHRAGLGGMEHGDEEKTLKQDLKQTSWYEAKRPTDVKHQCPVCGTRYWGRPNKKYCGTPCKEVAKREGSENELEIYGTSNRAEAQPGKYILCTTTKERTE